MTVAPDDATANIVAAVQRELTRFGGQVTTEVQHLRDELAAERAARTRNEAALRSLAPVLEQAHAANTGFQSELQRVLDARLAEFAADYQRRHDEMGARIGRITDETNIGLTAAVESAARPVVKQLEHRQAQLESDVVGIAQSVRKFDDQAAKLVLHLNVISEATDVRLDEMSAQITQGVEGRLEALANRVDDVSAQAARHQAEVSIVVGSRVDQAEDRVNERIIAAEARVTESIGQRVADIDAYVGRVSAGLDDSVAMLSDRIASTDGRFDEINSAFDAMHTKLASLDVDAIDELKDRVAGLAGQVELVRIEVERFEKSMGESRDQTIGRIIELETQMQDQHLDVETAVQLERLEEVERALIALDPGQFVRRGDSDADTANAETLAAPLRRAPSPAASLLPPASVDSHAAAQH